jgi:hypothetical protein
VRDYLAARLRGMGLQPRVLPAAAPGRGERGRTVENVVAVLPGRDRAAPAVLVMSHYDSVPRSPGAADDAAGVAVALETARALRAGAPPARDVIFLFTDGEELGLLGARAWFAAGTRRIGAVLNMEARGGGGRALMFETGRRNGEMVELFARTAPLPASNSLAVFVYERMPNGTDFTIPKELGLQGMNFAFIGRPGQYHQPSSTPAALDRGSLQHMGDQVLAATRALAQAERLPRPAADLVYSDVLGAFLVRHPAAFGWGAPIAAALLLAFAGWRAAKGGFLHPMGLLRGVAATLYFLLVTVALLRLAGRLAARAEPRALLDQFIFYEAALGGVCLLAAVVTYQAAGRGRSRAWAAVVALVAGAAGSFAGLDPVGVLAGVMAAVLAVAAFGRPVGGWNAWLALLLFGLALTIALQALAPTTAFITAWPLLAGSAAAALIALRARALYRALALAVTAAFAAVTLGQVGSWAHGVALGVGAWLPEPLALFAFLGVMAACPLLMGGRPEPGAR